ncbi:MAG: hypothetical protein GY720_02680, partial [bacterium]|nr:hypothetical protein [bacterium]
MIGDYVWEDTDQDGIQDPGEGGINGVIVNLYQDLDLDGAPEPGGDDGSPLETVATYNNGTNDGYYEFGMGDGQYFLEFVLPSGYSFTPQDQGGDDAVDSDANTSTGLTAVFPILGSDDDTRDAGMYGTPTALVSDYVWHDLDRDGIQDGTEVGINGVDVTLYQDDGDGLPDPTTDYYIDATTTVISGTAGYYEFANLAEANYFVAFDLPPDYILTQQDAGGDDTIDSDPDPANGYTDVFFLLEAVVTDTIDAGMIEVFDLGDYVWVDPDENGIQGVGEGPLAGVVVNLYADVDGDSLPEPGGDDGGVVLSTMTNALGFYEFTDIVSQTYFIEFELRSGYTYTLQDQGGDDALDSDADPDTGLTSVFHLAADDATRDAGMLPLPIVVDDPGDGIDAGTCSALTYGDLPGPDGVTTLREAICVANNNIGLDLISFDPALAGVPIVLSV